MLLIISLIIVALFIYFLKGSLKKHAGIYYIGAAVISIAVYLIGFLPICKGFAWNGNVRCSNVRRCTA